MRTLNLSEAVALVLKPGYAVSKAVTNLGIGESALRQWIHKAQELGLDPKSSEPLEKQLRALKRELERTRQERDILKKQWHTLRTHENKVRFYLGASS